MSVVCITLSTVPPDSSKPGYQAPLPLDQVKPLLPPSRPQSGTNGVDAIPRSALAASELLAVFISVLASHVLA